MKQRHNKFTEMVILLPVMVFLVIAGYYFYTSYTGYNNAKKPLDHSEYDHKFNSAPSAGGNEQKIILNSIKQNLNTRIESEQRVMMISALVILLSLLYGFIIRNIFSKIARDDKNLKNVFNNIEIDPKTEKEYNLKEMFLKEDKTEIYHFLEKIIQELEESKHLAERANQIKTLFLANMSHEIRTPLNGIVGFTDLLRSSGLNSEQDEFVQIIEKSSENLLSIIDDILDLSKIESEKIDIEDIEFDPIIEFESGIESYGAKASEKHIDLGFYIDPALSNKLKGDPNKIKQVLVNLMSNAVKFTPDRGNIDILIEKIDSSGGEATVLFSVKDSGIGISLEQRKKIFEAFSQADSSTSREFGGTGLGLTISKKLVELMGGNLDLESENGKGSTFFFTLQFQEIPSETKQQTFEDLRIGYYLPRRNKTEQSDIYIKKYLAALNPKYIIFNTIESLVSLGENKQPDLIFVNFDHVRHADMIRLNTLKSKISLLTTGHKKDEIKALNLNFFKTLYSPINFSKIKRSLLDFNNINIDKNIKKSKKTKFTNIKALVAEDNVINQKLIKITLENIGISVTLANNGKEAFNLRRTEVFDIIFMDIQMPVMNGIEATQAILAYEKEKEIAHIPIVALTANALKGDKERFLAEGMDQYISKPIKLDTIRNILNLYFTDKPILDNNISNTKETLKKEFVDILLCKKEKGDLHIFDTLLQDIGYSVDCATNIEDLKKMIQSKNYTHVLLDRNLDGLSEDNEISQMMKSLSIKSILLVEDRHLVRGEDYKNYTRVVLNIPNIKFLDHIIKLNLR